MFWVQSTTRDYISAVRRQAYPFVNNHHPLHASSKGSLTFHSPPWRFWQTPLPWRQWLSAQPLSLCPPALTAVASPCARQSRPEYGDLEQPNNTVVHGWKITGDAYWSLPFMTPNPCTHSTTPLSPQSFPIPDMAAGGKAEEQAVGLPPNLGKAKDFVRASRLQI